MIKTGSKSMRAYADTLRIRQDAFTVVYDCLFESLRVRFISSADIHRSRTTTNDISCMGHSQENGQSLRSDQQWISNLRFQNLLFHCVWLFALCCFCCVSASSCLCFARQERSRRYTRQGLGRLSLHVPRGEWDPNTYQERCLRTNRQVKDGSSYTS